jgi:acyl-CoA dehydrogenase
MGACSTRAIATGVIQRRLFSDEHRLFRATVLRFLETEVIPQHSSWETAGVVSREIWARAGELGLLCCNVPEEYGGQGSDFLASVIMAEEFSRAGANGPYFHLHSDIVAPYLLRYGSEAQKTRWLPKMATGEVITAIAMTEPRGGSDLQGIETKAVRDGDHFVLDGQKVFISNGQLADMVIVAARTNSASEAGGITLFVVEADQPGYIRGRNLEKIGLKAQDTSELFFEGVRVHADNILGVEGRGFYHLVSELPQERLLQAIRGVAAAEAAIDWTVEYALNREVFGQPLASYQNTAFRLAEMTAATLAQRVFVDRCIEMHLEGALDSTVAAVSKLLATDLQCDVMDSCLQLFGGWGYMWEYPIARAFADARQTKLAGGSSEVMKTIISRKLFKTAASTRG